MKINDQMRNFLDQLTAAGIQYHRRADFGAETSVWQFSHPNNNRAVFAILRAYDDGVGFGLYLETDTNEIADDVATIMTRLTA